MLARLANLPGALPGACAQGLIWGIMAIGVYHHLPHPGCGRPDRGRLLRHRRRSLRHVPALGRHERLAVPAGCRAGGHAGRLVTGLLHTAMRHPGHPGRHSDPAGPVLHQPDDHGQKANQAINVDKYDLLVSLRWVKEFALHNPILMVILVSAVVIAVLYWFFGTELGCSIRATGSNPAHVPRTGHQHQLQHRAGSGRLQRSGGAVRRSAEPSIRALRMSTWAAAPSSSVWPPSSSVRLCLASIFHNFALKMVSVSLGAIIYYIVIQAGADRSALTPTTC